MRLIDADWLLENLEREFGACYDISEIPQLLSHVPTVDAVPVAHGKWEQPDFYYEDDGCYQCSVCKAEFYLVDGTPEENNYHFCPSCGAKMDFEE